MYRRCGSQNATRGQERDPAAHLSRGGARLPDILLHFTREQLTLLPHEPGRQYDDFAEIGGLRLDGRCAHVANKSNCHAI